MSNHMQYNRSTPVIAKKKGYKEYTFTLTFNRKINPTKKQVNSMYRIYYALTEDGIESSGGNFGGGFYYAVVDYKTGLRDIQ